MCYNKAMHPTQDNLLKLAEKHDLSKIPLRKIAAMLGKSDMSPAVLQHHFLQLKKKGLLFVDRKARTQQLGSDQGDDRVHSIPIVGAASCGPANELADEQVEGYLTVSKRAIPTKNTLFAVRASGDSMNNANVKMPNGTNAPINDGDYVVVDTSSTSVYDNLNSYVISIINGMANIKKLARRDHDLALISESISQSEYPPIVIHEDDDYLINGRVIAVIKP